MQKKADEDHSKRGTKVEHPIVAIINLDDDDDDKYDMNFNVDEHPDEVIDTNEPAQSQQNNVQSTTSAVPSANENANTNVVQEVSSPPMNEHNATNNNSQPFAERNENVPSIPTIPTAPTTPAGAKKRKFPTLKPPCRIKHIVYLSNSEDDSSDTEKNQKLKRIKKTIEENTEKNANQTSQTDSQQHMSMDIDKIVSAAMAQIGNENVQDPDDDDSSEYSSSESVEPLVFPD